MSVTTEKRLLLRASPLPVALTHPVCMSVCILGAGDGRGLNEGRRRHSSPLVTAGRSNFLVSLWAVLTPAAGDYPDDMEEGMSRSRQLGFDERRFVPGWGKDLVGRRSLGHEAVEGRDGTIARNPSFFSLGGECLRDPGSWRGERRRRGVREEMASAPRI